MENFFARFDFRPEGSMLVGVERERFFTDKDGNIVPISPQVLECLGINGRFGFELSACQLEDRVGPCHIDELKEELLRNDNAIRKVGNYLGFGQCHYEVAPDDMPLDVYPDPTGRYQEISGHMPRQILLSACQVIGTHVHIGMPDHETALRVYNKVIEHCDALSEMGDNSNGRRLEIYKIVAPDRQPPKYTSWNEFLQEAKENGFVDDPRSCWHIIRLSIHGTIEFRNFGTTEDIDTVVCWAKTCHDLCEKAIQE